MEDYDSDSTIVGDELFDTNVPTVRRPDHLIQYIWIGKNSLNVYKLHPVYLNMLDTNS